MQRTPIGWLLFFALSACGDHPKGPPGAATSAPVPTQAATATATAPPKVPASTVLDIPNPPSSGSAAAVVSATGSALIAKPTATVSTTPSTFASALPSAVPTGEPVLSAPVAGSADEVAFNIDKIFKDTPRYKAGFIQKHKQKITGVEREQKGTVFIARPNKISFRYDPPNKNRIVSDGTTLRLYVAEDQQMFEHAVKNTEYPGAFGFIMGSGIRPSFNFAFNDKATFKLGPVLIATPRVPSPQYEQVLFYVDKDKLAKGDPGAVNGVLILDAQSNKNRFELHDASFPTSIDATEFTFTPPAGTNITK